MFFYVYQFNIKQYFAWRNFANIDKIIVALHKKLSIIEQSRDIPW